MKLHDPERPSITNGAPALMLNGRAYQNVPILSITPEADGTVTISAYMKNPATSGYSDRQHNMDLEYVAGFLTEWREDPEKVARYAFGFPQEPSQGLDTAATLKELGL